MAAKPWVPKILRGSSLEIDLDEFSHLDGNEKEHNTPRGGFSEGKISKVKLES